VGITGEKRGGVVSKNDTLAPFVEENFCLIMCPPDTIEMLCQFSLSMKKDSLFVSFVCHIEISQTIVPLVALLVPL
jgi:hypothetical protein